MINQLPEYIGDLNLLLIEEDSNSKNHYYYNLFKNITIEKDYSKALDTFNSQDFDIVIVELENNYEEKFTLIDTIKLSKVDTVVIIVSSDQSNQTLREIINLNIDGYIQNPIEEKELSTLFKKLNKKLSLNQENRFNKYDLNLLKQYQDIADKNSIMSKADMDGNITYTNDNFCKISGYTKEELLGQNHRIVKHPDNDDEIYKAMWNKLAVKKEEWTGILKNISKTGITYYVKSTIRPILDTDGNVIEYISIRNHISTMAGDKKPLLNKIESNFLSLLILIQIEDYNILEKFYSASTVNQIEKEFGYNLLSYLPQEYIFENVFSLNNGQFALLTDFDKFLESEINIEEYLNKFVSNVKSSILEIDGIEYDLNIALSYSFGKHMLYEDAKSGLEESINKRLIICSSNDFSIKDQEEARKNIEVIKMVKIALEEYKIVSYFQPIINNKTREIEKYESLVRLIDENDNIISPFEFLGASKKGNYYNKITHRVLENTFKMLEHVTTKLSINLSVIDLEKEETVSFIFNLLDKYKDHKEKIIFELLEDENIKDMTRVKKFIKTIKAMGILIAIDDFGAGYSNFERLLEFEPDIIKIDGVLIRNIIEDTYSRNVVETIVDFARKQNIKTIAEYVENEEIFNYLEKIGVDYSQGFYFGRPEEMKY